MTYPNASLPTFVLIHGAFHGGWCWRRVADRLASAGARVFTPTMTGLGERAHLLDPDVGLETFIRDALGVIDAEEITDCILVGHSFGGMVISGVADRRPGAIRRLVYLDAVIPENGRSALDLLPADIAALRRQGAEESSGGLSIPVPSAANFDVPPGPDIAWLERRLTPHPLAAYADPIALRAPVGNGLPRSYIHCIAPLYRAITPSYERVSGEPGWNMIDLATGHDAMITAPELTAQALLNCATQ
jgi:pimeloyl-ACP methyl ester carboxylesterase